MSTLIFIVPIVLLAVYLTYRSVKREIGQGGGGGTCPDCPSRQACQMHLAIKQEKEEA
ncbi:hypothetical protein GF339_23310 [candidate division KSB3 bacterium]|uniref:FeoB-associated Cys-rich membrane protein n=1 Tax=candidate division KSB3 bacterium TaxID=2044937 RepID=A0A9D5K0B7_9BACT|nr:hypothetical protein [candidate division KSB3 bacterium]MBD3327533.1 hypothetical protein [candidate division KSB3 bacterium]